MSFIESFKKIIIRLIIKYCNTKCYKKKNKISKVHLKLYFVYLKGYRSLTLKKILIFKRQSLSTLVVIDVKIALYTR